MHCMVGLNVTSTRSGEPFCTGTKREAGKHHQERALQQVTVHYTEKAVLTEPFLHACTRFLNFNAVGSRDKKMVVQN